MSCISKIVNKPSVSASDIQYFERFIWKAWFYEIHEIIDFRPFHVFPGFGERWCEIVVIYHYTFVNLSTLSSHFCKLRIVQDISQHRFLSHTFPLHIATLRSSHIALSTSYTLISFLLRDIHHHLHFTEDIIHHFSRELAIFLSIGSFILVKTERSEIFNIDSDFARCLTSMSAYSACAEIFSIRPYYLLIWNSSSISAWPWPLSSRTSFCHISLQVPSWLLVKSCSTFPHSFRLWSSFATQKRSIYKPEPL